jgi:hypothetical protein
VELADGRRVKVATGRGDARVCLTSAIGENNQVTLKDALLVPSFQNIFSVKCATQNGASVGFEKGNAWLSLESREGKKKTTVFPILTGVVCTTCVLSYMHPNPRLTSAGV